MCSFGTIRKCKCGNLVGLKMHIELLKMHISCPLCHWKLRSTSYINMHSWHQPIRNLKTWNLMRMNCWSQAHMQHACQSLETDDPLESFRSKLVAEKHPVSDWSLASLWSHPHIPYAPSPSPTHIVFDPPEAPSAFSHAAAPALAVPAASVQLAAKAEAFLVGNHQGISH